MKTILPYCLLLLAIGYAIYLHTGNPDTNQPPGNPCRYTLDGTWLSNKELTLQHAESHCTLAQKQKDILYPLFGRLEVTFDTKNGTSTSFVPASGPDTDDWHENKQFTIVAETQDTIHLLSKESDGTAAAVDIHFIDADTYWMYLGDSRLSDLHMREFFTRKKSN